MLIIIINYLLFINVFFRFSCTVKGPFSLLLFQILAEYIIVLATIIIVFIIIIINISGQLLGSHFKMKIITIIK